MKNIEELLTHGVEHHKNGNIDEAMEIYDLALSFFPNDPRPYFLMGTAFQEMQKHGAAIGMLLRSMDLMPRTETANNLGIVLRLVGHEDAALDAYTEALRLDPSNVDAMANMSGFYVNQGDPDKGIYWAKKTLEAEPTNAPAKSHLGLCYLEKGDWNNGWDWYRTRTGLDSWHHRNYAPYWEGQRVKKLIIHGEQGLGDEILFMSWWPRLKEMADEIIIECTPRLVKLFERTFGVRCYGTPEEVPDKDIDAQCPMGHIPHFLGGVPPEHTGYLTPDPERVKFYRKKLEELGDGPYIGLSWKGGLRTTHMHLRNTPIEDWKTFLMGTPISIQYGLAGAGAQTLDIPHWQEVIDDLDELAALIKALDLVITVCNTSVHLAGAVNTPCFCLVPDKPAWRYQLSGDKMPWYSSVKMFRQKGDWSETFKNVRDAILDFIGTRRAA